MKDSIPPTQRAITAWHEAGHAVVATVLGTRPVLALDLYDAPGAGELGGVARAHTELAPLPPGVAPTVATDDDLVLIMAAGSAAIFLFNGDTAPVGTGDDLAEAERRAGELLAHLTRIEPATRGQMIDALLQDAWRWARGILEARRPALAAVATALLAERHLDGDRVRALIAAAHTESEE